MIKFRFFLSLFFFTTTSFSQDSLVYYNTKITKNYNAGNFTKSTIFFQKKLNYLNATNNLEEYYYAHFDYYLLDNSLERIDVLKPQKTWRKATTNKEKIAYLHLIINKAYHYNKYGAISKSVNYYQQALNYYQINDIINYDIISYCLQPLGNNYTRLGDYSQAEEIFKYTIQLAEKKADKTTLIATYQNLSIKYQSINKNDEAIAILEKALQIKSITSRQKSRIYALISKNYYDKKEFTKAILYIDKSDNNKPSLKTIQKNELTKGLCFIKTGRYELAKKILSKALVKSKNIYGTKNRETVKLHNLLASIDVKLNQPQKALAMYQKSLQLLMPNYQPKNMTEDNPSKNDLFAENTIKETLDSKANLLIRMGKPLQAIANFNLAFEVEKLLQKTYTSQESKLLQHYEIRERTEKIVSLYYDLYQKSNKQIYINLAFETVENSKALVLSEILNSSNLKTNLASSPLIIQQKILLKDQAVLVKNKQLEELKDSKADLKQLKKLNKKLTKINTKLHVLQQEIHQKYPFLNGNSSSITTTEVYKKLLQKEHQIISFLDSKTALYIFSLQKDKKPTLRRIIKTPDYRNTLKEFVDLFSSGHDEKLKSNISNYKQNAFNLYSYLLAKELHNSNTKKLTLITDGILNFVAFDALLTSKTNSINFSKLPYLLFKQQINYGYSAKVLIQQLQKTIKSKKNIIGFFPVFENDYRGLQEISHTINEKSAIEKYLNGTFLTKGKALKETFLSNANEYNTIHLSTHASAGNLQQPAHIEFRNNTLYLPEIYGLHLNTNLLVLSACETGVGKLQKGEGALSLARGFSYAGIKNVLVSLWKVNDKATSVLMRNFYKNYKKSNHISYSIHQAKIDYLNDKSIANTKKTPFYWSSFVFVGNLNLVKHHGINWLYISFGLFSIILFIIIRKRK